MLKVTLNLTQAQLHQQSTEVGSTEFGSYLMEVGQYRVT